MLLSLHFSIYRKRGLNEIIHVLNFCRSIKQKARFKINTSSLVEPSSYSYRLFVKYIFLSKWFWYIIYFSFGLKVSFNLYNFLFFSHTACYELQPKAGLWLAFLRFMILWFWMLEKTHNIFVTYEIQILLFINKILLKKKACLFSCLWWFSWYDGKVRLSNKEYSLQSPKYLWPGSLEERFADLWSNRLNYKTETADILYWVWF